MKSDWPTENIVLGLLAEQPMHGYELAQRVRGDEALRAIWRIERSEVYFLLGKLAKSGYIVETGGAQGAGPTRVVFTLTETGRSALDSWLRTPEPHPRNLRSALLARVYIALRQDPRLALELIEAQKQVLRQWLALDRRSTSGDEVVAIVHHLRAAQVRSTLEALDGLRSLAARRLDGIRE